jgi:hypothetical protein
VLPCCQRSNPHALATIGNQQILDGEGKSQYKYKQLIFEEAFEDVDFRVLQLSAVDLVE